MLRDLNKTELTWIYKLLGVNFKGSELLKEQISKAKVSIDENYAYISIKFSLDETLKRFPYKVRVPIEMRVFQEHSAPILFLLHVVNGFVNELEILTADSSKIDINSISLKKIEYEINNELRM